MSSQAHPDCLVDDKLKDCSETMFFLHPALKELGKGWSWLSFMIIKMRCTGVTKIFWFP